MLHLHETPFALQHVMPVPPCVSASVFVSVSCVRHSANIFLPITPYLLPLLSSPVLCMHLSPCISALASLHTACHTGASSCACILSLLGSSSVEHLAPSCHAPGLRPGSLGPLIV